MITKKRDVKVDLAELVATVRANVTIIVINTVRAQVGKIIYDAAGGDIANIEKVADKFGPLVQEIEDGVFTPMERIAVEIMKETDIPCFNMEGIELVIPAAAQGIPDDFSEFEDIMDHIMEHLGLRVDENDFD